MDLSTETLMDMYRQMRTIRVFEDKLSDLVNSGKLAGFLHLYAGQEAIAVAVCANLRDGDMVNSNHRGHGHCIAKGVDIRGMMAELFGRATGTCKGKGGSMHIADLDKGMLGANGIVGAGIPLTVGAALTAQVKKTGGVAVAFFGDGATNQGQFHEALNLAAVWKLPAVFVAENNGYGEATPTEFVTPSVDLTERAASYCMRSDCADGMDFFDVYDKARTAVELARKGEGPTLLECKTYRYYGHYVGDPMTYRRPEETEEWKRERDPLDKFESHVIERGLMEEGNLRRIDDEVVEAVEQAVTEAEAAPMPSLDELTTDVYYERP